MLIKALLLTAVATSYSVNGDDNQFTKFQEYEPRMPPVRECGTATEYGHGTKWHGDYTATNEKFRPKEMQTCAHRTMPFGTTIYVQPKNGPGAWCRINDRGPYMVRPKEGGKRQYLGTTLKDGYEWDGFLDVSVKTARASGLDGKEYACIRYFRTPKRPEKWTSYREE